jgi:hypothetical protein
MVKRAIPRECWMGWREGRHHACFIIAHLAPRKDVKGQTTKRGAHRIMLELEGEEEGHRLSRTEDHRWCYPSNKIGHNPNPIWMTGVLEIDRDEST